MATSGDIRVATREDFFMATDKSTDNGGWCCYGALGKSWPQHGARAPREPHRQLAERGGGVRNESPVIPGTAEPLSEGGLLDRGDQRSRGVMRVLPTCAA
jgi:hypothetical protein